MLGLVSSAKRGHEFLRKAGRGIWESLEGGEGWEKCLNYNLKNFFKNIGIYYLSRPLASTNPKAKNVSESV